MIYFDSAATSFQKPPQVLKAYAETLRSAASPGRGAYRLAMRAAEAMLNAREEAAAFFRFSDPERVVLTMNATHALNLAIRSLAVPGAKAVISGFEHNSVLRPLYACGMEITTAGRRLFDPEELLGTLRTLPRIRRAADRGRFAERRRAGVGLLDAAGRFCRHAGA